MTTKTGESGSVFRFNNADVALRVDFASETFESVKDAESWLDSGALDSPMVAGLIPYESSTRGCSLYGVSKDSVGGHAPPASTLRPSTQFLYDVGFNRVEAERYLSAMDSALARLGDPSSGLRKVVLSRVERYLFDGEFHVDGFYDFMSAHYSNGNNFCVRNVLRDGCFHMGSSPELFMRRTGRHIVMHPLAGSLPKNPFRLPEEDRRRAALLLGQPKFRDEHRYLVEFLREGLAEFCVSLDVPAEPDLVSASNVWHLGTRIEATLKSSDVRLSDMLSALHPSPAVCGVPRSTANEFIADNEGPRGYYAGLVGWFDARANCELYMALRGLEVDLRSRHVDLRAGGGIVRGSSIPMEFGEAAAKLLTMQKVLGIGEARVTSESHAGSGVPDLGWSVAERAAGDFASSGVARDGE